MPVVVRRTVSSLVAIVMVAISLAAAIQVLAFAPKFTPAVSAEQMHEWLRNPEAQQQPLAYRQQLARRLERDFRLGHDWAREFEATDEDNQPIAIDNFSHLLGFLLAWRVEQYQRLPEQERDAWLDQQINQVLGWTLPGNQGSSSRGSFNLRPERLSRLYDHVATASEGRIDRQQFQEFSVALTQRWLMRDLRKLFPAGPRQR